MRGFGKYKVPYLIFILQRIWKRTYQGFYWCVVVAYRFATKRWFIFRDCPDWFVRYMSRQEALDDDEQIIVDAALDEKNTRIKSRRRELNNERRD